MDYLYHRVPKSMEGTILYPLNILKNLYPKIYDEQVKKYEGRERLLTTHVPILECLWNDVLHLTAVSPQELKNNLDEAGIKIYPKTWFKIPTSMIDGKNSVAFIYKRDQQGMILNLKEYENFDANRIDIYREVPIETLEYYKQKRIEGSRPLLFHLTPHILYKGNIDTRGLEIISI